MSNNRYVKKQKEQAERTKANKHIDFVVIVYVIIFAYILYLIYAGSTKQKTNYSYVEPGSIHSEGKFNALVLREEETVYAQTDGTIKYFVPEGNRVRQGVYICSIGKDIEMDSIIDKQINSYLSQLNEAIILSPTNYKVLKTKIRNYCIDKKERDYDYMYVAKASISNSLKDIAQTVTIKDQQLYDEIQNKILLNENQRLSNGTYYRMPYGGVVSYAIDGFEDYSIDHYDYGLLNKKPNLVKVNKLNTIKTGEPLYKIISNYLIHFVVEIDPIAFKYLENKKEVEAYFPKKNLTATVKIKDLSFENEKYYGVFQLERHYHDFIDDRFEDIIFTYQDYTGLKIPKKSLVSKELYKIPKQAVFEREGSYRIKRLLDNKDKEIETIPISIYYQQENDIYVGSSSSESSIQLRDTIVTIPETGMQLSPNYVITDKKEFTGVYIINKGYVEFKLVEIEYEDEEFVIVKDRIGFSVRMYDRMISDSRSVEEFDIVQ